MPKNLLGNRAIRMCRSCDDGVPWRTAVMSISAQTCMFAACARTLAPYARGRFRNAHQTA